MSEQAIAEKPRVSLDLHAIMEMIPHRYPFLMIDRIEDVRLDESATGIKTVTLTDPSFQGHFTGPTIQPGVLIIEAMAQTAAVCAVATFGSEAEGKLVYFMTIDEARFRKPVVPGDTLEIYVTKIRARRNVWKFRGEARVRGAVVSEAEFSAMIVDR